MCLFWKESCVLEVVFKCYNIECGDAFNYVGEAVLSWECEVSFIYTFSDGVMIL